MEAAGGGCCGGGGKGECGGCRTPWAFSIQMIPEFDAPVVEGGGGEVGGFIPQKSALLVPKQNRSLCESVYSSDQKLTLFLAHPKLQPHMKDRFDWTLYRLWDDIGATAVGQKINLLRA